MQSTHIWISLRHRGCPQKLKTDLHNSSKCHVFEVVNHFLCFKIFSTSHTGPFSVYFLLKTLLFIHSQLLSKLCHNKLRLFSVAWLISAMWGTQALYLKQKFKGLEQTCLAVCWYLWWCRMGPMVTASGQARAEVVGAVSEAPGSSAWTLAHLVTWKCCQWWQTIYCLLLFL